MGPRRRPRTRGFLRLLAPFAVLAAIAIVTAIVTLLGPPPSELTGRAFVVDGDSLRIGATRLRIAGIDAPEYDQICADATGAEWNCGVAAREALSGLVGSRNVTCRSSELDRYGRSLATCTAGGADLGEAMVRAGMAVADGDYGLAEIESRLARRGIWKGSFDRPADWRAHHGDGVDFDPLGWLRVWFAQLTGATKLR